MPELATVSDVQARIVAAMRPGPVEVVDLADSLGRVLASDVLCRREVPGFANSSMDGYAVVAADTTSGDVRLPVVAHVGAGARVVGRLTAGTAMAIMTGAPLPPGADAVVAREDTDDGRPDVHVMTRVTTGTFVRHAGEDMRQGDVAVSAGTRLRSHHIAALATVGAARVAVHRRPRVALLSTGDELVQPGVEPAFGEVVDSNRPALAAAITAVGGVVVDLGVAADTPDAVRTALERASDCDLIISSAGVSVGDHDHVRDVVESMGNLDIWRVAMRPGKPLAFGRVGAVPFVGLPGNPVSSQVTFELFGRPAVLALQGDARPYRERFTALLAEPLAAPGGLETYHRGALDSEPSTTRERRVRLTGPQGSGIVRSLALADCLIVVPADVTSLDADARVTVIPLD